MYFCTDAIKKQVKFSNIIKNEIEETIKQVLAQAPFNIKRKMDKKTSAHSTTWLYCLSFYYLSKRL